MVSPRGFLLQSLARYTLATCSSPRIPGPSCLPSSRKMCRTWACPSTVGNPQALHPIQASSQDQHLLLVQPQPSLASHLGSLAPSPTPTPLHPSTADKPEATPEQLRVFQEAIVCMGMSKSEIMYTDEKKVNARSTRQCPALGSPRTREGKLPAKAAQLSQISCF